MRSFCLVICLLLSTVKYCSAFDAIVYFTAKGQNIYTDISQLLSEKALSRRIKNHIAVDFTDYPVEQTYINQISNNHIQINGVSKWLNAVYISNVNTEQVNSLYRFPFVKSIEIQGKTQSSLAQVHNRFPCDKVNLPQRDMIEAEQFHFNGITGTDVLVCVMDDGFKNVQNIEAFNHLFVNNKIKAVKDFLSNEADVYSVGGHGTAVFSNIAGYIPGKMYGTAYGASFLLARTEIDSIESAVEMFQWARAAEWADSIGADIFSTSLGYTQFDDPTTDYYYADMNGKTTIISKAAALAVSKGILVINSAGNEGNNSWKYISAPADVEGVVTVGAVDSRENFANFSSRGPTWDGRLKPDICCQGVNNLSTNTDGGLYYPSGTSFSCPTFSGLAACIMQIAPNKTVNEIKEIIYSNCTFSSQPNNDIGRGVPKGSKIYESITGNVLQPLSNCDFLNTDGLYIYPVPASQVLFVMFDNRKKTTEIQVNIYNIEGKPVYDNSFKVQLGLQQMAIDKSSLPVVNGLYYIRINDIEGNVLIEQKILFL